MWVLHTGYEVLVEHDRILIVLRKYRRIMRGLAARRRLARRGSRRLGRRRLWRGWRVVGRRHRPAWGRGNFHLI
jgi:hypothetical protein